ncbi:MAG: iron-containing alcohol dehydrogenase [Proteobacteria bacterium]|nr:iron-containing alcohol dehydrogenase [Pseudomonadota bacterium]
MSRTDYSDFLCPIKFCCGKLALETLPAELRVYNARKPLILFSNKAVINGLIDPVKQAFDDSEMVAGIYDGVPESPTLSTIRELSDIYIKNGHDALIAVGSGSVMNLAKVLNIVVSGEPGDLKTCQGEDKITKPLNPFFVVPEASATGLMANGSACIDNFSFTSRYLIPDYLAIDPRIVQQETVGVIIDAAMRALSSSSFAYTLPDTDYFIDPYAYLAIQTICENLIPVIENADSKKGFKDYLIMNDTEKGKMALVTASVIGGFISFCQPAGIVMRLSEALSEYCQLSSGILAGLLLPYGLEYAMLKEGYQTEKLLLALAGPDVYSRTPENERGKSAMGILRDIQDKLFHLTDGYIPRTLAGAGISENQFSEMIERMSQNDEGIDSKGCLSILNHAREGRPVSDI